MEERESRADATEISATLDSIRSFSRARPISTDQPSATGAFINIPSPPFGFIRMGGGQGEGGFNLSIRWGEGIADLALASSAAWTKLNDVPGNSPGSWTLFGYHETIRQSFCRRILPCFE